MLGALGQSIAIMGQKLGQAELARADITIRPKVLDIGPADFTQRASAILEGEKAAVAAMPQIRERIAQLQAERAKARSWPSKRRPKPSTRPAWTSARACRSWRRWREWTAPAPTPTSTPTPDPPRLRAVYPYTG
ncbi:hypothetical protein GY14_26010 [Delftia tsuruhatensis]|nr:hypothetical protein GY14_26010 [Delftia tsuruhatensis]